MEEAAGSPIHPGARCGDLEVHEFVGRGAHSTVYRATDALLHRDVALKVVTTALVEDPNLARDKILREARMVAKLSSPYVVTLYRVHDLPDSFWAFEMEYLAGGSLSERIESEGPLPEGEVRRILHAILRALEAAHSHGIVHHDIKPANVLMGEDGSVKLTDFGLGRFMADEELRGETGHPRGTPYYMAPEVVMGLLGTPHSDLWSVGVLLYRMLTGRHPFPEQTIPSLFLAIQNAMPPPLDPSLPPQLVAIALHCLAKAPHDRPTSATAILEELSRGGELTLRPEVLRATAGHTPTAIVGRHLELDTIRSHVDTAARGEGQTVLLMGESGIGKTALAAEIGREVRARGFRWIEARLSPVEGLRRPLLNAIRHCLEREAEASSGDSGASSSASEKGRELLDTLRQADDAAADDDTERLRASWHIEATLASLAGDKPLAVLIEDIHVCERSEIRMLARLSTSLAAQRVFLAFTWRTQDPDSSDAPDGLSSGYYDLIALPHLSRLELEPLQHDALRALIESTAGVPYVPLEIVERVVQESEGVPLYAITLLRHLEAAGEISREGGTLRMTEQWGRTPPPRFLRDMVRHRLEHVGEEDRSLLETAAVAGVSFDGHLLAHLCGKPLLTTLRALQRLYRDRMLVVPLDRGFRFTHALYRDAIYADLSPDLKRALHQAWAEELTLKAEGTHQDPELLGLHWEQADRPDRAAAPLREASRAAVRRGELARAWDLARRSGALEEKASNEQLRADLRVLLSLNPTYATATETERVTALCERVRLAAEELKDDEMLGRVMVAVSWNEYSRAGAGAVDVDALASAIETLPHGIARGNGAWLLGNVAEANGDLASARNRLEEARTSFAAEHDPQHERHILSSLGFILLAEGENEEARRRFEEAVQAVPAGSAPGHEALARALVIATAAVCGDVEGTGDAFAEPIRMLEQGGQTTRAGAAMSAQARCYVAEGEVRKARAVLDRAEPILLEGTMLGPRVAHLTERARLDIATGAVTAGATRLALARETLDAMPEPDRHEHCLAWAFHDAVTGRPDAARTHLFEALDEVEPARNINDLAAVAAEAALLGALGLPLEDLPARVEALVEGLERRPPILDLALKVLTPGEGSGSAARDGRIGTRQAEFCVAADLIEARAMLAQGSTDLATPHVKAVSDGARRLNHVWFELAGLRLAREAHLPYDEARILALRRLLAERNPDRTSDTAAWLAYWLG